MSILERIQELCKNNGINPSKLEAELGLGKGTLYKWEKSSPSAGNLKKVADYFNVSLDYLLRLEEANDDFDLRKIERARKTMPEKDRKKMMDILKVSFEEYFDDAFEDDDKNE